ncbi:hypothetical protein [Campylobacter sp. MG1]|uniref:hypothetical protein n=1 Tax=Campylobacter sp. MG1 TaxID=2976332 RepID=UPI00226D0280|nr:hypothetical protein [Campylobacter sp. MG1]
MNIFLGEKSSELLKDEAALKEKVAKFLGASDGDENVAIMLNLLKQGQVQEKVLAYDFMQLPFNWVAGIFTGYAFVYRRLWMAWLISIAYSMVIAMFSFTVILSILIFCASIFVFGKFHYYFLLKKFVNKLDLGINTDNLCAPCVIGVVILIVVQFFFVFLLFGFLAALLGSLF